MSDATPNALDDVAATALTDAQCKTLLAVARTSVQHGLVHRRPPGLRLEAFDEALRVVRATFVTLRLHGQLRGCIGSLEARRPLVEDVAFNAYHAAFHDPRFPGVLYHEVDLLEYHISILSPAAPMTFADEADLLRQIQPGVDGLILEEPAQGRLGTFLPSVWETVPRPDAFLSQLKLKAGLPADYWSRTIKVSRYRCESVH